MNATTTLYRAYDATDRLLYVGISDSPLIRLGKHSERAAWAAYAVKITLERSNDRESAAAAELSAIHDDDPVWNMDGRPLQRYMQWMVAYPTRHADDVSPEEIDELCRTAQQGMHRMRAAALDGGAA